MFNVNEKFMLSVFFSKFNTVQKIHELLFSYVWDRFFLEGQRVSVIAWQSDEKIKNKYNFKQHYMYKF